MDRAGREEAARLLGSPPRETAEGSRTLDRRGGDELRRSIITEAPQESEEVPSTA